MPDDIIWPFYVLITLFLLPLVAFIANIRRNILAIKIASSESERTALKKVNRRVYLNAIITLPFFYATFLLGGYLIGMLYTFLILIIGIVLFVYKIIKRKKSKELTIEEVRNKNIPFYLYLRSFDIDGKGKRINPGFFSMSSSLFIRQRGSYERDIKKVILSAYEIVALGKPGESSPQLGSQRLYLDDNRWKDGITELIRKAVVIIVNPSLSKGLDWELNYIEKQNLLFKTAFYIHVGDHKNSNVREARYDNFRLKLSKDYGVKLPEYQKSMNFAFVKGSNSYLVDSINQDLLNRIYTT